MKTSKKKKKRLVTAWTTEDHPTRHTGQLTKRVASLTNNVSLEIRHLNDGSHTIKRIDILCKNIAICCNVNFSASECFFFLTIKKAELSKIKEKKLQTPLLFIGNIAVHMHMLAFF